MKRIVFSSNNWTVLSLDTGSSPASCSCQTHISRERPPLFIDVEHCQHGEGSIGVLRQAGIANLGKAPEALEGEEGMFDLGSDAGLASVRGFVGIGQRAVFVDTLVGEFFRLRREVA